MTMNEEREERSNIKIEDIEKILDKNFLEKGSADKAIDKIKTILQNLQHE